MSPLSVISRVQYLIVNPLSGRVSIGTTLTIVIIQQVTP